MPVTITTAVSTIPKYNYKYNGTVKEILNGRLRQVLNNENS